MKNSRLEARSFFYAGMMGQPPGTGLPESREKVLKMDGAFAPRVFRIDGLSGRGLWYRLTAMNINAACGSAPFGGWRHHLSPRESVSHDSQVASAPLRIVFACHPASGGTTTRFRHRAIFVAAV